MVITGRERLKVIKALAEETEYKGGSALTVRKLFGGWGRYPCRTWNGEEYPVTNPHDNPEVRTWVYSYGTPIAWVMSDGTVVIPDHRYSVTTTHHQGLCRVYLANLYNAAPWIARLLTMWVIQCQVEYDTEDGWHGSKQVPTFLLNPDMVGTSRHTIEGIVRDIVDPLRKSTGVHVSAVLT